MSLATAWLLENAAAEATCADRLHQVAGQGVAFFKGLIVGQEVRSQTEQNREQQCAACCDKKYEVIEMPYFHYDSLKRKRALTHAQTTDCANGLANNQSR